MDLLRRENGHFLPELPNAGLLWRAMCVGRYRWMYFNYPEDFYQEAALFLVSQPSVLDGEREILAFCRQAQKHFYRAAISYGWYKPSGGSLARRELCFSSIESDHIECGIEATLTYEMTTAHSYLVPRRNGRGPLNNEELITKLQGLAKELERTPRQIDLSTASREGKCYSSGTYASHFGSYTTACQKAGLTPNKLGGGKQPYCDQKLITKLQVLAKELGRTPEEPDVTAASHEKRCYAYMTYRRHFGSYAAACKEAGLERVPKPRKTLANDRRVSSRVYHKLYTKDGLANQLHQLKAKLGRDPSAQDVSKASKANECACPKTFSNYFGTFNAAMRHAGLKTREAPKRYPVSANKELIRRLQTLYGYLGRVPLTKDLANAKKCASAVTYVKRFGSWGAAIEAAEIRKNKPTKEGMIGQLKTLAEKLGRKPRTRDVNKEFAISDCSNQQQLADAFGSYNNAMIAAGFAPNSTRDPN